MALLEAHTNYGTIIGLPSSYQSSSVFRGIPYAKAPTGTLRWKSPERPTPWSGKLHAFTYGNVPMQVRPAEGNFYRHEFYPIEWPCSEDCLYINVVTPANSAEERLPVALWVYGGGFTQGYSQKLETDGEAFAQRGVVYVSFNYRVGPFGFLSCNALDSETPGLNSGNYGLLDQIAALDWVYENIAAFGGDPKRITIFGQSAGAMSVFNMLCSPLTKGEIAGAIMESGGGPIPSMLDMQAVRSFCNKFFDALGCSTAEEARKIDATELMNQWIAFVAENQSPALPIHPVYGTSSLPKDNVETFREGKVPDIPMIIGTTSNEDCILKTEEGSKTTPMRDGFLGGAIALCEKQAENGRKPAFMYHLTNTPPGEPCRGAFHSSEHMYIFQTLLRSWRPYTGKDMDLSNIMCGYWTNFIKTGNPNGPQVPQWNPYEATSKKAMKLDREGCGMIGLPKYAQSAKPLAEHALGREIEQPDSTIRSQPEQGQR